MQVVEESLDVLVVKEAPWGFRTLLFVMIAVLAVGLRVNWGELAWLLRAFMGGFIAVMAFIFCRVALDVTARLDRRTQRVEIVRRGLLGAREESHGLGRLERARVQESKDSDGSTYRLVLVFSEAVAFGDEAKRQWNSGDLRPNEIAFTSYLTGDDRGPVQAAAAINAWLGVVAPGRAEGRDATAAEA